MIVPFLLEAARQHPNRLAVTDPFRRLTFKQLLTFAKAMRRLVRKRTQCPRVGLMLPSSAAGLGTIFGILWANRTFVPLNFLLPAAELSRVIADAKIDLIISTVHFESMLSEMDVRVLYLERLGLKWKYLRSKFERTPEAPDIDPDETAGIIYTSGTSGEPKGVCLSYNNFVFNCRSAIDHLKMTSDRKLLGVLPSFHVFGLTTMNFVPVILQTVVHCIPRFSPQAAVRALVDEQADVFMAVPSMYAAMARLKSVQPDQFSHVKISASGGEPLPDTVYEEVQEKLGLTLIQGYGLTETSPIIAVDLPWAHRRGTVGPPLPGVEVRICDVEDQPVKQGEEGEIQVRGPLVMKGYYNQPDQTASVLDSEGWFHTGDLGQFDEAGYLRITGRMKDLIIVGGDNVYPREVEAVLEQHPAVSEAAVIGMSDGSRGEVVVGFVCLHEDGEAAPDEIRGFCRGKLANYKIPRQIMIRSDLPRGPTGKILRRRLVEDLNG